MLDSSFIAVSSSLTNQATKKNYSQTVTIILFENMNNQQRQSQQNRLPNMAPIPRVKWNSDECRHLCLCWISISEDPIIGDSQRENSFWQRIEAEFCNNDHYQRSAKALKSKFSIVNKSVQTFNGCYNMILQRNESGKTEQDQLSDAAMLFRVKNKNKAFIYLSSWEVIKNSPKWNVFVHHEETFHAANINFNDGKPFSIMFFSCFFRWKLTCFNLLLSFCLKQSHI